MIQNYLKTGMVFYRDMEEQHFRQSCCKEDFCQFTDRKHFPSFQFYSKLEVRSHLGFTIYDLNDVEVHSGQAITTDFYHHIEGGTTISHDFRDSDTIGAQIITGTCYYAMIEVFDPTYGPGYERWYSEAFKVCDCDVMGVGDGVDLITNGIFRDWDLAANPNNTPDNWAVNNNDATNYVDNRPPPAGISHCQMISDNGQILYIEQDILTIGQWYTFTIDVIAITLGSIYLRNTVLIETFAATGHYNVVFQAQSTPLRIYRTAACDVTFTNTRVEEFVGFAFCDMITLNWWSDCDWDDIIYQDGYRNNLVLGDAQGKIVLDPPKEEITGNAPSERLGDKKFSDIVIKKHYRFNIRIPEYLWNALIRLPAYGSNMPDFHCWITIPIFDVVFRFLPDPAGGRIIEATRGASMKEVDVLGEWDTGNCMNTFTIEFIDDEYPVVATNCCKNEDVSEV